MPNDTTQVKHPENITKTPFFEDLKKLPSHEGMTHNEILEVFLKTYQRGGDKSFNALIDEMNQNMPLYQDANRSEILSDLEKEFGRRGIIKEPAPSRPDEATKNIPGMGATFPKEPPKKEVISPEEGIAVPKEIPKGMSLLTGIEVAAKAPEPWTYEYEKKIERFKSLADEIQKAGILKDVDKQLSDIQNIGLDVYDQKSVDAYNKRIAEYERLRSTSQFKEVKSKIDQFNLMLDDDTFSRQLDAARKGNMGIPPTTLIEQAPSIPGEYFRMGGKAVGADDWTQRKYYGGYPVPETIGGKFRTDVTFDQATNAVIGGLKEVWRRVSLPEKNLVYGIKTLGDEYARGHGTFETERAKDALMNIVSGSVGSAMTVLAPISMGTLFTLGPEAIQAGTNIGAGVGGSLGGEKGKQIGSYVGNIATQLAIGGYLGKPVLMGTIGSIVAEPTAYYTAKVMGANESDARFAEGLAGEAGFFIGMTAYDANIRQAIRNGGTALRDAFAKKVLTGIAPDKLADMVSRVRAGEETQVGKDGEEYVVQSHRYANQAESKLVYLLEGAFSKRVQRKITKNGLTLEERSADFKEGTPKIIRDILSQFPQTKWKLKPASPGDFINMNMVTPRERRLKPGQPFNFGGVVRTVEGPELNYGEVNRAKQEQHQEFLRKQEELERHRQEIETQAKIENAKLQEKAKQERTRTEIERNWNAAAQSMVPARGIFSGAVTPTTIIGETDYEKMRQQLEGIVPEYDLVRMRDPEILAKYREITNLPVAERAIMGLDRSKAKMALERTMINLARQDVSIDEMQDYLSKLNLQGGKLRAGEIANLINTYRKTRLLYEPVDYPEVKRARWTQVKSGPNKGVYLDLMPGDDPKNAKVTIRLKDNGKFVVDTYLGTILNGTIAEKVRFRDDPLFGTSEAESPKEFSRIDSAILAGERYRPFETMDDVERLIDTVRLQSEENATTTVAQKVADMIPDQGVDLARIAFDKWETITKSNDAFMQNNAQLYHEIAENWVRRIYAKVDDIPNTKAYAIGPLRRRIEWIEQGNRPADYPNPLVTEGETTREIISEEIKKKIDEIKEIEKTIDWEEEAEEPEIKTEEEEPEEIAELPKPKSEKPKQEEAIEKIGEIIVKEGDKWKYIGGYELPEYEIVGTTDLEEPRPITEAYPEEIKPGGKIFEDFKRMLKERMGKEYDDVEIIQIVDQLGGWDELFKEPELMKQLREMLKGQESSLMIKYEGEAFSSNQLQIGDVVTRQFRDINIKPDVVKITKIKPNGDKLGVYVDDTPEQQKYRGHGFSPSNFPEYIKLEKEKGAATAISEEEEVAKKEKHPAKKAGEEPIREKPFKRRGEPGTSLWYTRNDLNEDRWESAADPAAVIPGEPIYFLDAKGDFDNAKGKIIEITDPNTDRLLGYQATLGDGSVLQNIEQGLEYFDFLEDAMRALEEAVSPKEEEEPIVERPPDKIDEEYQDMTEEAQNRLKLRDRLIELVKSGKGFNKTKLIDIAEEFGIEDQDAIRDVQELALLEMSKEIVLEKKPETEILADLVELYEKFPTTTIRTSTTFELQQYSTLTPISYIMQLFTGANVGLSTWEPSAGNGSLVFAHPDKSNVWVNEIDPSRILNLEIQKYKNLTKYDASKPISDLTKVFQAVLTNPPFGMNEEPIEFDGYKIKKLEHVMAAYALQSMMDDGRAAIIIGGHNKYDKAGKLQGWDWIFFNWLYHNYNVADVMNIDGDLYRKMGASFPIRLILINGRKAEPEGYAPIYDEAADMVLTDYDTIYQRMKGIQGEIILQPLRPGRSGRTDVLPDDSGRPTETGPSGGIVGGQAPPSPGTVRGGRRGTNAPTPTNRPTGKREPTGISKPGGAIGDYPKPDSESAGKVEKPLSEDVDKFNESASPVNVQPGRPDVVFGDDQYITKYVGMSKSPSLDYYVPMNMAQEIYRALRNFVDRNGDIDEYVKNNVGFPSQADMFQKLNGAQIDGLALAIEQIQQSGILIIGDMTGVGKGRQMASLIGYAVKKLGKKPIFFTESAKLFNDFYRDMKDVGLDNLNPFIMNNGKSVVDEEGNTVFKVKASEHSDVLATGDLTDYDYVMVTYSQVMNPKKYSIKPEFLQNIAKDNILILDESHTASGESNISGEILDMILSAQSTIFSSATWAKRASNMTIYAARSSMSQANMSLEELIDAINHGGVPIQEITSAGLATTGEYIRRELGFDGIRVEYLTLDEAKAKHIQTSDKITELIRDIVEFQKEYINKIVDGLDKQISGSKVQRAKGVDRAGVDNTPFASKVHNIIDQLLFSLKADQVADLAIKTLKENKKVIIGVKNTMENFLKDLDFEVGEEIEAPDFSLTMIRALNGVMKYKVKDSAGTSVDHYLSPNELGPAGKKAYDELVKKIRLTTSGIPISPIDWLHFRLKEAGYKVVENTGRSRIVQFSRRKDGTIRTIISARVKPDPTVINRQFNDGEADVNIINISGATGISLHASPKFKDKRQRSMIIHQEELDISKVVQKRGRINRAGQVALPEYLYVSSAIPAEQRLMMMLKRKLKSLDANTTSKQKSIHTVEIEDFLNKYGDQIVFQYLRERKDINEIMDDPLKMKEKSEQELDAMGTVYEGAKKASGRAAWLPVAMQEEFYDEVTKRYKDYIKYLDEAGQNDLQVTAMPLNAKTLEAKLLVAGKGGLSPFGKDTYVETVESDVLRKPYLFKEIQDIIKKRYGEKDPEQINEELLKDFDKWYEQFVEKERKSNEARWLKKKEKYEFENMWRMDYEVDRGKLEEELTRRKTFFYDLVEMYQVGKAYKIPLQFGDNAGLTGESGAIFLGLELDKSRKNPYAPSAIKATFAVGDSRRYLPIPTSKRMELYAIQGASYYLTSDASQQKIKDNWDKDTKKGLREIRQIITGNIIQSIEKDYAKGGRLIAYTTSDGDVQRGILLPESADLSKMKYVTVPASRAVEYIADAEIGHENQTNNGVEITKTHNGNFEIRVPKSRKGGGDIFLNEEILSLVKNGKFYAVGQQMTADLLATNLERFLKVLENKFGDSLDLPDDKVKPNNDNLEGTLRMDITGGLGEFLFKGGKKVTNSILKGTGELPLPGVQFTESELMHNLDKFDKSFRAFVKDVWIPFWTGEKYPGFGDVWENGRLVKRGVWGIIDFFGVRMYAERTFNLLNDPDGLNGFKDAHKLNIEQYNKLLFAAKDLNENYVPYEMTDNGLRRRYGFDDATIKVWREFRKALSDSLEVRKDLDRYIIVKRGQFHPTRTMISNITEDELQAAGFDEETIADMMLVISKPVKEITMAQVRAMWQIPEIRSIIAEKVIKVKYKDIFNYFPMTRPADHKFAVLAYEPQGPDIERDSYNDGDTIEESYEQNQIQRKHFATFGTAGEANRYANYLKRQGYTPAPGEAFIRTFYIDKDFVNKFGRWLTPDQLYDLAEARGIDLEDPTLQSMVKELKSRGFDRHLIKRDRIKGLQWTRGNVEKNITEYVIGAVRKYTKFVARHEAEDRMAEITELPGHVRNWARVYLDHWLGSDPVQFELLRQALFVNTLGLSVSNLIQELISEFLTTWNEIPILLKQAGVKTPMLTEKIFFDAYRMAIAWELKRAGKKISQEFEMGIPDQWAEMIEKAIRQRVIVPLQLEQIAGIVTDPRVKYTEGVLPKRAAKRFWRYFTVAMATTKRVSEKFNRDHGFFVGLMIGEKYFHLSGDALYEFAVRLVSRTQGTFGKHNIQTLQIMARNDKSLLRFINGIPRLLFMLRGWDYHIMGRTASVLRSKNFGANVRNLSAILGLAGVRGLPWMLFIYAAIDLAMWLAGGDDTIENKEREIFNQVEKDMGLPDRFFSTGPVGAYTGVETSRLIGGGNPLIGFAPQDVLGVAASKAVSMQKAIGSFKRGQIKKGVEEFPLTPRIVSAYGRGRRYEEEGVISFGGNIVTPKEDLTPSDIAVTKMGFQPTKVAEDYELQRAENRTRIKKETAQKGFLDRYVRALESNDKEEMNKVIEDINEYNAEAKLHERIEITNFINNAVQRKIDLQYQDKKRFLELMRLRRAYEGNK